MEARRDQLLLSLLLCSASSAVASLPATLPAEPAGAAMGSQLARTVQLLEASSQPGQPPVRVLFYGQSIVEQGRLQSTFIAELKKQFPGAQINAVSTAIGGYMAPKLVRTTPHTVVFARPDLIVFDDYGGDKDGTYEEIIHYLRSHTTADVILWSPHVDNFNAAMDKQRDAEGEFRRSIAEKYKCEFADVRAVWKQYLEESKLPRTALLRDPIHNTTDGCELIARILARHFVKSDAAPSNAVQTIALNDAGARSAAGVTLGGDWASNASGISASAEGATVSIAFTGTRLDVLGITEPPAAGTMSVEVDGQPPSKIPAAWAVSLPSPAPVGWFPAVNRVSVGQTPLVRDDWTLHFHDVSPDGKTYRFELKGKLSGSDGEGESGKDFGSTSGRFSILASDVTLAETARVLKKPMPATFDVTFRTFPLGRDLYQQKPGDHQVLLTLVDGLPNTRHTLKLTLTGGAATLRGLVVHCPQWSDSPDPASK